MLSLYQTKPLRWTKWFCWRSIVRNVWNQLILEFKEWEAFRKQAIPSAAFGFSSAF